ncbi:MAG: GDP-mannose 4,6-dehydratase, partial [Caldilineales bacterium]|nr:GDP-mannose 4,6-dehydratase [Caldilineales bacterium]
RALVTGGAGYIGSHLCDALIAEGYHVTVVDNLSTGKIENIRHLLGHPRFRFVNDTILHEAEVERQVRRADVIYHLAAVVGVKWVVEDPLGTIQTNLRGTEIVLEKAFKHWRRVVIASSSEVYGKSEAVPLREDADTLLGPTAVGRWSYALAKALDEHLGFIYAQRGLPVSIVRYFNSYGPRLDPRGYGSVMAKFINQALRNEPLTVLDDGRQTRCFTYVSDTVRGTILAGTQEAAIGQVFNIGNNRETSILELAHMVLAATGSASPIVHVPYEKAYGPRFEETRRRVPDIAKAEQLLGFRPQVPLEEGLQRTIEFFRTAG